ncbi:MAG: transaldolase [Actinophytocola sp.]|nr:transaldolase [Actinophytocola sp.]
MPEPLRLLSDEGVAIWLDDLSRHRLTSGSLAELVRDRHVVGVTTNPTIFRKAIAAGADYAEQIRDLAALGIGVEEAVRLITTHDVRAACDQLRDVFDATGGRDGRVSIEVDPRLANDTERTLAEAQLLWWLIDRPNLFVKIPATPEGLPAISRCLAGGISVNVTLIFSLERYEAVLEAYLTGLEAAADAGRDLSRIESVASFFVSRVDTEIDKRLDKIGTAAAQALRGKAALANARLAHRCYEQVVGSQRWRALEAAGARPQRPLWASTGVKNPAYDDTRYVVDLVAPGVVNTMPEATLHAVADHGAVRGDSIRDFYADALRVFDEWTRLGVDYEDVVATLEHDGVRTFADSWRELLESVGDALAAAPNRGDR